MEKMKLGKLIQMWNSNEIVLPDWQRVKVWTSTKSSKFCDNLMRDKSKVMSHFSLSKRGEKLFLLDGYQRVSAITKFLKGEIKLGSEFKGKKYNQLTPSQKEFFNKIEFRVDTVSGLGTIEEIEFFQNINSGKALSNEQLRKAQYHKDENYYFLKMSEFVKSKNFKINFNSAEVGKEPEHTCIKLLLPKIILNRNKSVINYNEAMKKEFDKLKRGDLGDVTKTLDQACYFVNRMNMALQASGKSLEHKVVNQNKFLIFLGALVASEVTPKQFQMKLHEFIVVYKNVSAIGREDVKCGSNSEYYGILLRQSFDQINKVLGKKGHLKVA